MSLRSVYVSAAGSLVQPLPSGQYGVAAVRHFELLYWSSFDPRTAPIVVWVHGGGWTVDSAAAGWLNLFTPIVKAGFVIYFMHYTLCNGSSLVWPVNIADCKALMDYLSTPFVGDPSRISIFGWSAGAHLALMTGLTSPSTFDTSSDYPRNPYTIKCIVAASSPTDLYTMYQTSTPSEGVNGQTAIVSLLGYNPTGNQAGANAASPISYATSSAPPTLLLAGDSDILVPDALSSELVTAFNGLGVNIQLKIFAGMNHALDLQSVGGLSGAAALAWLNMYGK